VNPRVVYFMYYFVNILLVLVAMAMLDFFFVCWDLYKIIFLKGMMLKIFSH
jgi:hypothetical protein